MAKVKLTLTQSPTFKADVSIPVPGESAATVKFTFKARTRSEFKEWAETLGEMSDADAILDCACGWDLEYPFDREHVEQMLELYMGAAPAVLDKYISELMQARVGNSR